MTHLRVILLLLAGTAAAAAADPRVTASISTNRAEVGDRVTLTVRTVHEPGQRVILENFDQPPLLKLWNMSQPHTAETAEGEAVTEQTASFSSFFIGEHRVATNGLLLVERNGDSRRIQLPATVLRVDSVLSNPPPALAEIKPPMNLPGHRWLRILAILGIVLIASALLALLILRWVKKPGQPQQVRVIPPHDIAFAALDALLKRGYIESGQAEAFYVELSSIVRLYLEERFDLHAPEQTTEEFIRASGESSALGTEHRQLTREFLEQSDLVKFARFTPGGDEMKAAWDAAARLVRETIERPAAGEDAPA